MTARYSRQSFLGENNEVIFASLTVGIVGLGGGGSHIAQQLAHLGVQNFILTDDDRIEDSNLNRLVGGTHTDVSNHEFKASILARLITGISPDAQVTVHTTTWQAVADNLRDCDCIFGCVDSLNERKQLETFSRRFMIPYIDIGIDIFEREERFYITGQVARFLPNSPCLECLNILNEHNLTHEAQQYGAAGGKPQVVWANGTVASGAIGMFVETFTGWNKNNPGPDCLDYDGNKNTLEVSNRMKLPWVMDKECEHYPKDTVGDPFFSNQKL